jgi:hypothetical protein
MLRLLDEPIDIGVGETGCNDTGAGLPPAGDQFPFRLNRKRDAFVGANAAALQLIRDFSGCNLNHIGGCGHSNPSFLKRNRANRHLTTANP